VMDRLGSEVRRELGRFGPAAGMADLVAAWPAVVGDAIARNAWPARLARDGTLHVATSSAAWAFELAHLEADLLERLRPAAPEAPPARLRFAVGRLPEPANEPEPVEKSRIEPSEADRKEANRLSGEIANEELREAVAEAAAQSLARASSGRSF
jgi:predicted nucleic acid-binding Zn ribbon protein